MGLLSEFKDFLYEYKVIPLAVAFIMGIASTALVKSLVDNIIMPLITPFIPGGAWREATLELGSVVISWGGFSGRVDKLYYYCICSFSHCKKGSQRGKSGEKVKNGILITGKV